MFAQLGHGIFERPTDAKGYLQEKEVTDILQDQFGFIWLATTNGLLRYDAHSFKHYRENPLDPNSLGDNFINVLLEDDAGNLWIGTAQEGLFCYNRFTEKFKPIRSEEGGPPFSTINDLLLDSRGRIWVAAETGLGWVDRTTDRIVHFGGGEIGGAGRQITCLGEDRQQRIWVGTGGEGLFFIDPETEVLQSFDYATDRNLPFYENRVIEMAVTEDGLIWFSTEGHKLNCLDPTTQVIRSFTFFNNPQSTISPSDIWVIQPEPSGNLWLGTHEQGLIYFSPASGEQTLFQHAPEITTSIADNNINALLLDDAGTLWIGYIGNGVGNLATYSNGIDGLPVDYKGAGIKYDPGYRCLLEDRRQMVWIGTQGNGLIRYDAENEKTDLFEPQAENPNSPAHGLIWDMMEDRDGCIWLATHGGVQRLDPEDMTFTTIGRKTGLQYETVRSVCMDHTGRLWIGTFSGLHWLDEVSGKIHFVDSIAENPYFIVLDIMEDPDHYLWVSSFGGGVHRLDPVSGQWSSFTNSGRDLTEIGSNISLDLLSDHQGGIWFATQGGGLNQFVANDSTPNTAAFRHWRPYNSDLSAETIINIAESSGRLWLSTDEGFYAFDPRGETFQSFTLPGVGKLFNLESRSSPSGRVYLGNNRHIYRFHPDSLKQNTLASPVFIIDFQIKGVSPAIVDVNPRQEDRAFTLDQSILYSTSLALSYRQNDLTFEFTTLNYTHSEKNRYRYKLEGYEEKWIETDALDRRVRYTNLSPGEYIFRVIAANNDGTWNTEGKSLALSISPPWWLTWAAYLAYGLLTFLIIRGLYVFQLRRELAQAEVDRYKELNAAKTRLFTNVTHEFRTPLTIILGMAEQIKVDPSAWLTEGVAAITRNGQQLLKLVNQMLDLSRLEAQSMPLNYVQGDVMAFLGYQVQAFQSYAASRQVDLLLIREPESLNMDFAPELLSKVMNNLLSNAIKFTPEGGEVEVTIHTINHRLSISIKDNGIGISAEQLPHIFDRFFQAYPSATSFGSGTGVGLALVKELVDLMHGTITVASVPEVQTVFELTLPINHEAPAWSEKWQEAESVLTDSLPQTFPLPEGKEDAPIVLIIEDNADVARYTASCLQHGYRMVLAENGRIGVEKALELIPEMIICDVMMPEMDGYEVCRRLKLDDRTSHIPIVMLTAKVDEQSRIEGLRSGVEAYLAKPFNREELEIRLEKLIEIRHQLQQKYAGFPATVPGYSGEADRENAFLQRLRSLIHNHLDNEQFGIADLCHALATSRPQLHRKLKALTGRSTSHVIRSIRLEHARKLVLQTDFNISQIAYQCGFKQHSYFTTLFTQEFGISPTELRENSPLKQ